MMSRLVIQIACPLSHGHGNGNHRNQLVETGITNFWGLKWLGSLYRACLLFRSGCHWVKMWLAVEGVVRSQLKADKAAHPPYLAPPCPYNLELVDYLESNYRMFPRAAQKISARDSSGDADEDDQPVWALTEGGRQWRQALWELVAVLPFPWCGADLRTVTPTGRVRDADIQRVMKSIRDVLLRTLPTTPCAGKWTKSGPSSDSLLQMILVCSMLKRLMEVAFGKGEKVVTFAGFRGEEQTMLEEIAWQEVTSKRMDATLRIAKDMAFKFSLVTFCIVKEPLRFLTSVFLRASSRQAEKNDLMSPPRLCNFVTEELSPIILSLQYFGWLLKSAGARRLRLISELEDFGKWKRNNPQAALTLRRALLLASSWTDRRHELFLERDKPWRLVALCDSRLSTNKKRSIANDFASMQPCQLEPQFARLVQQKVESDCLQLYKDPRWQCFLDGWARSVRCSIACVEFLHRQNNGRAHRQMTWTHFLSLHIISQQKALAAVSKRHVDLVRQLVFPDRVVDSAMGSAQAINPITWSGPLRAQNAEQVFRLEVIKRDKSRGLGMDPCTGDHHKYTHAQFRRLTAEELQHYQNLAELTIPIAKANQKLRKAWRRGRRVS